eukprot:6463310-Amphidinium_carterae.1
MLAILMLLRDIGRWFEDRAPAQEAHPKDCAHPQAEEVIQPVGHRHALTRDIQVARSLAVSHPHRWEGWRWGEGCDSGSSFARTHVLSCCKSFTFQNLSFTMFWRLLASRKRSGPWREPSEGCAS